MNNLKNIAMKQNELTDRAGPDDRQIDVAELRQTILRLVSSQDKVEADLKKVNKDTVAVSKKEISSLSDSLTNVLNSFSQLSASHEYISEVRKAISQAQTRQQSEAALENRQPIPSLSAGMQSGMGGDLVGLMSSLTTEIQDLSAAIEKNGIGGSPTATSNTPSPISNMVRGGLGGAAALGGTALAIGGGSKALDMFTRPPDIAEGKDRPMLTGQQMDRSRQYTEKLSSSIEGGILASIGQGVKRFISDASPVVSAGYDYATNFFDGGDQEQGSPGSYTASGGMRGLLNLIASGESRAEGGYNSMNQGARDQASIVGSTHNAKSKLGKNLTDMTIGEIKAFQRLPRGHPQKLLAAGRYQMIPGTLDEATRQTNTADNVLFDEKTQDKLAANYLIMKKQEKPAGGPGAYISGKSKDINQAVHGLAREFASMPTLDGRSYYPPRKRSPHSVAQVKAALSSARSGGGLLDDTMSKMYEQGVKMLGGARSTSAPAQRFSMPNAFSSLTQPETGAFLGAGTTSGEVDLVNMNVDVRGKKIWDYARKNGSDVDWNGLKQGMKDRFLAMAIEYKAMTGSKIAINSGNRTYAKQAALYRQYGPRRAAPPGRSKHESGVAIDVNSSDGEMLLKLGLLAKYGFFRPYRSEPWHIEPVEAMKVKGQADNPYKPGAAIAQTGRGGKPIVQDSSGKTKPVADPKRDIGTPTAGAAITVKIGEQETPVLVKVIPVGGGSAPGMGQYLGGMRVAPTPKSLSRNPVQEYRAYFTG